MEDTLDIESVSDIPEELGAIVSPDYTTKETTLPGKYASEFRTITFLSEGVADLDDATAKAAGLKGNKVKTYLFQVDLKGLVDRASGRNFRRPDRHWISTRPTRERVFGNFNEFKPGVTSDIQKYLSSCGYPFSALQNIKGIEEIKSILEESSTRPVGVTTGLGFRGKDTGTLKANGKKLYRTPRGKFNRAVVDGVLTFTGDESGKGIYTSSFAKDDKSGYFSSAVVDGESWDLVEQVERYHRLNA
jgi:hypothetical protein